MLTKKGFANFMCLFNLSDVLLGCVFIRKRQKSNFLKMMTKKKKRKKMKKMIK